MKAIDTLELPGSLVEKMRALDGDTLRRSWRALVVDAYSDELSLRELTEALQIVHDRVVLGGTAESEVMDDGRVVFDRVVAAALREFPHLDDQAVIFCRGDRTDGKYLRMLIVLVAFERGVRLTDMAAIMWGHATSVHKSKTLAKERVASSLEFAGKYARVKQAIKENRA